MKYYSEEYGKLKSVLFSAMDSRKACRKLLNNSRSEGFSNYLAEEIVSLEKIEHYTTLAMIEIENLNK